MCDAVFINNELYEMLEKKPIYTLDELHDTIKGYNVSILERPISNSFEGKILFNLTNEMFDKKIPMLYPFLYGRYVFDNTLYLVVKKPLGPSLKNVIDKNTNNDIWWSAILYQIAKAVWYLEEMGITLNNLSPDTVFFQTNNYKELDNIAIVITDFSRASPVQPQKDLQSFFKQIMSVLPTVLQESFITVTNYTGKNITQFLGLRYPVSSDRCSLFSLNKISGVSIGALFGNIFGTPFKYAKNYNIPNLPIAPIKSNGYYSCNQSCIPVAGVFTEPIYHSLNIIYKRNTRLDLYTLSAMWVYSLMFYKIGTADNVIEQIRLDFLNSDPQLLLAHQFIAVLIYYLLNEQEFKVDRVIEKVEKHFSGTIIQGYLLNNQRPLKAETIDDILKIVVWSLKNLDINKDMWISTIKKVVEIPGLTDLTCSLIGSVIGSFCGYKDCIPIQWGFTMTPESTKYNRNVSLSNYREIISNFVHC